MHTMEEIEDDNNKKNENAVTGSEQKNKRNAMAFARESNVSTRQMNKTNEANAKTNPQ